MTGFERPEGHQPVPATHPRAALRVVVTDLETGETSEEIVLRGDYLLVYAAPCRLSGIQAYKDGETHVITVKGRTP